MEQLSKYNGWLFALANIVKAYCWCRIQCRDAKLEAHEARVKARDER